MDKLILEKKVDFILRCLNRIHDRIPKSEHEFLRDFDAQDVVILNLTRAVQVRWFLEINIPTLLVFLSLPKQSQSLRRITMGLLR